MNSFLLLIFPGKNEFASDEDAHVVGDCVKVFILILLFDVSLSKLNLI